MYEEKPTAERGAEAVPPRIYVASLSDYNDGRLHGSWVDAAQEPDQLVEAVEAMLRASRVPGAEEWAIHDYEGFGPLGLSEHESLEQISQLGQGIAAFGEAFAAFAGLDDGDGLDPTSFEARYQGRWDCLAAYADGLLDELGAAEAMERLPDWLQAYVRVDYEQFARDLELGGDVCVVGTSDGGVFVFTREA